MTKAERDLRIAEAIEWMLEEGFLPEVMGKKAAGTLAKFPGWVWDEKIARVLLEAAVLSHPQIQLVPCLANMRANWIHLGPASARAWAGRWRNWIKNDWDPLVSGHPRDAETRGQGDKGTRGAESPPHRVSPSPCQSVAAGEVVMGELAKIKERLGG
jgi:hypothetical protein